MLKHVEKFHLAANKTLSPTFLESYSRRVCPLCLLLAPVNKSCRRCERMEESSYSVSVSASCPAPPPFELPMWEDSSDLPLGNLRYVPQGVRPLWTAALTAELSGYPSPTVPGSEPSNWSACHAWSLPRVPVVERSMTARLIKP